MCSLQNGNIISEILSRPIMKKRWKKASSEEEELKELKLAVREEKKTCNSLARLHHMCVWRYKGILLVLCWLFNVIKYTHSSIKYMNTMNWNNCINFFFWKLSLWPIYKTFLSLKMFNARAWCKKFISFEIKHSTL